MMEGLIKEFAAVDAVATDILADKQLVTTEQTPRKYNFVLCV